MRLSEEGVALLGLLLAGALFGLVVVAMLDPACGPTGYEQGAWMLELFNDTASEAR